MSLRMPEHGVDLITDAAFDSPDFEIFREDHKPPLRDLFDGLEDG